MTESAIMRRDNLRVALSHAVELADGEAIEAVSILIYAVADYLDIDRNAIDIGTPLDGIPSMFPQQ